MAIIGDSSLSGLVPGHNQGNQPSSPNTRDNSGSGGAALRSGSDRGEGVILDLSAQARAIVEPSADAVSNAPSTSGAGDRDAAAERSAAREEQSEIREQAANDRRDASAERRERVDIEA